MHIYISLDPKLNADCKNNIYFGNKGTGKKLLEAKLSLSLGLGLSLNWCKLLKLYINGKVIKQGVQIYH